MQKNARDRRRSHIERAQGTLELEKMCYSTQMGRCRPLAMMLSLKKLPGTDLLVSDFCYGTAEWRPANRDRVRAMYDQFRSAGGNFFDSAHCYAFWRGETGEPERMLGELVANDRRDQIVVSTKGGHYGAPGYDRPDSYCSPGVIAADIQDSLDRLRLEHIDLYFLHRDDPRVPVSEIVDALSEQVAAGRIRYFGGSNWSKERFSAANAYADRAGKPGFVASQPLWNLAHFVAPKSWDHTHVVLNDNAAEIEWYTRTGMPVVPFSPTANGLFADPARMKTQYDNALTRQRRRVCEELSDALRATPNQIALAWLRQQPFPVIPILGSLNPDHLADALSATKVRLTEDQMSRLSDPTRDS